jgi:acyl carrier protein
MTKLAQDAFGPDPRITRILDIVAKETRIDRAALRPDAALADLGVESIDLTMAVFEIETAFDVDIPVISDRSSGAEFATVGDLVGHVIGVLDRKAVQAPASETSGAAG